MNIYIYIYNFIFLHKIDIKNIIAYCTVSGFTETYAMEITVNYFFICILFYVYNYLRTGVKNICFLSMDLK